MNIKNTINVLEVGTMYFVLTDLVFLIEDSTLSIHDGEIYF